MGKHIELIARGICVEGGKLLVCVNEEYGYGYMPGGHIEFGESASTALAREFQEECGITVVCSPPILGLELSFEQNGKRRHEVSVVFPVERHDQSTGIKSLEPDIRFEWWSIESLQTTDLRPSMIRDWIVTKFDHDFKPPTTMEWVSAIDRSHNS